MSRPFVPLAERIVDALLESDPAAAYAAGDHRCDDRLPDLSDEAVRDKTAMLREASHHLAEVDPDDLTSEDRVDHAVLQQAVDSELFALAELREHEWNPLLHNPGPLLHGLIARPFAPAAQRLDSLAARLACLPDSLATARRVLRDCSRIHVETAVGQFAGVAALIENELPALYAEAPHQRALVDPVAAAAVTALGEFVGWLRGLLDDADRDPRLGRRLWEAKLWHTLDTELSASELLARSYRNLDRVSEQIREVACELLGVASPDDDTVRQALDRLAAEHPANDSIVGLAEVALDEAIGFVTDHDVVTLVDDPLVIMEMPEFARGVAAAYCDAVGPMETADIPTYYAISPTPSDWSADLVDSFYREYNNHMVRNLTVHEAMPGHYLQLAHARRFRGSTQVRALCGSGAFMEGWAVYAEEVMADLGYGGLPVRLQQLKMQLRMTINAILDQLTHCEGLTESAAMELMMRRGYQEQSEASGKWRRALLTSTQLSTYFVGYSEVSAIARARPDGVSLRARHDAMLAHGSPPPRHVAALLGCTVS